MKGYMRRTADCKPSGDNVWALYNCMSTSQNKLQCHGQRALHTLAAPSEIGVLPVWDTTWESKQKRCCYDLMGCTHAKSNLPFQLATNQMPQHIVEMMSFHQYHQPLLEIQFNARCSLYCKQWLGVLREEHPRDCMFRNLVCGKLQWPICHPQQIGHPTKLL